MCSHISKTRLDCAIWFPDITLVLYYDNIKQVSNVMCQQTFIVIFFALYVVYMFYMVWKYCSHEKWCWFYTEKK